MTTPPAGVFRGSIIVHPAIDLQLEPRQIFGFSVVSSGSGLMASTEASDAWTRFLSKDFLVTLEELSWDLIWERQTAVQFEPGTAVTGETEREGQRLIMMHVHDTISGGDGNPKSGVGLFSGFDLLQRIRDHIIVHHLALDDSAKAATLFGDATVLLALEHFIKGVVFKPYALAEFYSVVEVIENRLGDRRELFKTIPKKEIDKITSLANRPEHDQRHAPRDAATIRPLPAGAIGDAALVAKTVINEFAKIIL